MCGIVGYVGSKEAAPLLVRGLRRLEYRGYDSVGVALQSASSGMTVVKTPGRVDRLQDLLDRDCPQANIGMGHSRWATHGPATVENAHPHWGGDGELALVHNGVIENHDHLRRLLSSEGYSFRSQTDTEVLAHWIHWHLALASRAEEEHASPEAAEVARCRSRLDAIRSALDHVEGSYALVIMFRDQPDSLVVTRLGSPLVIGASADGHMIGSDPHAISFHVDRALRLNDRELAVVRADSIQLIGAEVTEATHRMEPCVELQESLEEVQDEYPHHTLREIYQQPRTLPRVLAAREPVTRGAVSGLLLNPPSRILIAACGTSWHAGLYAKYLLEDLAGIPVDVEYASEYRYRVSPRRDGTLMIVVSQSGETADTVAALRHFRTSRQPTLAICNIPTSTLAMEADAFWPLQAGREQGVAATKSYLHQCAVFARLALEWGKRTTALNGHALLLEQDLASLPLLLSQVLDQQAFIQSLAEKAANASRYLFVGRRYDYPTALEGALKLKEIAYVSAEGFAAGELKHGPLALVDEQSWTIAMATPGHTYDKMLSNMQEIRARKGKIIAVCAAGDQRVAEVADERIEVPVVDERLQPLLNIVPLQLLAYHIAAERGCDIDRPRNLAKSVTVE
jgi:glucosamine--fructose-6-phosphate aminotransferase (isomerizing)